jgi:hypothetical protein
MGGADTMKKVDSIILVCKSNNLKAAHPPPVSDA